MQFLIEIDIVNGLRNLAATLCKAIYPLIGWLFELFMNIANVKLLSQADIKPIYGRVTLIITIIMVFYVTFEFVKYVIQPDDMTDKEKGAGKVVYRLIIVVLLIAFVPTIFDFSYDVQSALLENQVVSKIILGKTTASQEKQGRAFAANMFKMFYKVDGEYWQSVGKSIDDVTCGGIKCETIVQVNVSTLATDGRLDYIHEKLNEKVKRVEVPGLKDKQEVYGITFNGLFAIGVGLFIAYILVIYCVDLGVRVIQMAYLQVIAPVPIIGFLSPKKDNIFSKWVKQCVATYIDLFIRLAIMHFILLIAGIITNAYNNGTLAATNASSDIKTFTYVALILGLLLFMKKFPELIKELFPKLSAASGNLGLKGGDRVAPAAARALGMGIGGLRTGARHAIRHAAHVRAKKQADGWATGFSALTKEGREKNKQKRLDRKQHKAEAKQNKAEAKQKGKLGEKVNKLNKAENEYTDISRRLQEAKAKAKANGASQSEIAAIAALEEKRKVAAQKLVSARNDVKSTEEYQRDNSRYEAAKKAKADADNALATAENSGNATAIANAKRAVAKADSELKAANEGMSKWSSSNAESRAADKAKAATLETSRNALGTAKDELKDVQERAQANAGRVANAQSELDAANASGDPARIEAAERELQAAKDESKNIANELINKEDAVKKADNQYENDLTAYATADNQREKLASELQTQVEDANKRYAENQEQIVKDKNQNRVFRDLGVVAGTIRATASGAVTGAKSTKISEVVKNVQQADKNDIQRVKAVSKYYDDGGTGFIDRTIEHQRQQMGVPTSYERTMYESKGMEPEIKQLEAQSALTKDVKSTADSAEDRLKDKIGDLGLAAPANTIKTGLKDSSGNPIYADVAPNQSLADVYRTYEGRATRAKAESDSAAKRLDEYNAAKADILSKDSSTLTGAELTEYNNAVAERDRLQKDADEKATASANANYAVTQVQKNAARYEYSKILEDFASGKDLADVKANQDYEPVAVGKVYDALESIKVARSNPVIVANMKKTLPPAYFNAFMTGNITDFDTLDKIKTAAINAGDEYERLRKAKVEAKRTIETNNKTMAEKAAEDFNPGGGGK